MGYSSGDSYHYAYDAVGNRLTSSDQSAVTSYQYDEANRLASVSTGSTTNVNGVNYSWDANGNLLNDGVNSYAYDSANRLSSVTNGQSAVTSYQYNGLGDRLTQNGVQYTLDLNAGLTQVLADGTNVYTYGLGRIAQTGNSTEYFLGDALGSVRQLTAGNGDITLAKSYSPYGEVMSSNGSGTSPFAYTGEQQDASGLTYLRARYYSVNDGRFMSRDTWGGDMNRPLSMNRWNYTQSNPINYSDPSGNIPTQDDVNRGRAVYSCNCGWIDFGHANSSLALSVINLLNEEGKRFPPTVSGVRQDAFALSPGTEISIWFGKEIISLKAVVQTGLSNSEKDSVALGIYRNLEEKIENIQGAAGEWFTYFSFEDLTSDQIGFYLALKYGKLVNPANEGLEKNEIAWRDLAHICGFPENRHESILQSQQVYDSMNMSDPGSFGGPFLRLLINTPHVFTWGTPLLCELSGMCDDEPKRWPAEFNAIVPTQPIRNGSWWFYNRNLDGELVSASNESQFHYLK